MRWDEQFVLSGSLAFHALNVAYPQQHIKPVMIRLIFTVKNIRKLADLDAQQREMMMLNAAGLYPRPGAAEAALSVTGAARE